MTKQEFLTKVPHTIQQRGWGIATLEIITDAPNKIGVYYRHVKKKTTATCITYGTSWTEVHGRLIRYLLQHGLYT